MTLAFIDTETTGLDPRIHQPWEVCIWREDAEHPLRMLLAHTLQFADPEALRISNYWDRRVVHEDEWGGDVEMLEGHRYEISRMLRGATLVGSNPAFDAAMLTRFIGTTVWHHRMIDVSNVAMVVFDLDRPIGLADCADRCRDAGYEIPEPDHTAEGDVRTTRAVYEALREIGRTR